MAKTIQQKNKDLVLEAFDMLFNQRDYVKAAAFWSDNYIQHSAHIAPGRDGLFNLVRSQPDILRYENSLILAEGDYVMLHGRFSGRSEDQPWIAADIVKIENGRLAEHWDVLQDEATQKESKSGLPMFGTSFAEPDHPSESAATGSSLTVEEARKIVAPLYDEATGPRRRDTLTTRLSVTSLAHSE